MPKDQALGIAWKLFKWATTCGRGLKDLFKNVFQSLEVAAPPKILMNSEQYWQYSSWRLMNWGL